jgi:hypothetical protein
MAQILRPDSDVSQGSWTRNDGTVTPDLFSTIDEAAANDTDFLRLGIASGSSTCEVGLTDGADPVSSSGHIVRYRYRKSSNDTTGKQIDLVVSLRQGATQIAAWTHLDIGAVVTQTQTLSGVEADAITDYSDLRLRFVGTIDATGTARQGRVTWAEVEIPDVARGRAGWGIPLTGGT